MPGPGLVFGDVADKFVLVLEHGRTTGATGWSHLDEIQCEFEFFRQAGRILEIQHLVPDVELHDCRTHAAVDLFNAVADGTQSPFKRRTRRDHFEDLVLRKRKLVIALAIADVGNTDPDQFASASRQATETHLARYVLTARIFVQPFEYRMLAVKGTFDIAATNSERRRPIRLHPRADCFRANVQ